tara:strand:+ start:41 stop:205 length:165 start_codon:yes stop_codon:yes gene_type:complete
MTEKKNTAKKEVKKFWKITAAGWTKPILKLKSETSERYLKTMKSKKGYIVEEAD